MDEIWDEDGPSQRICAGEPEDGYKGYNGHAVEEHSSCLHSSNEGDLDRRESNAPSLPSFLLILWVACLAGGRHFHGAIMMSAVREIVRAQVRVLISHGGGIRLGATIYSVPQGAIVMTIRGTAIDACRFDITILCIRNQP
jgi:hypothetical protein